MLRLFNKKDQLLHVVSDCADKHGRILVILDFHCVEWLLKIYINISKRFDPTQCSLRFITVCSIEDKNFHICVFLLHDHFQCKDQLAFFTISICYIHLIPGITRKDELNKTCVGKEVLD